MKRIRHPSIAAAVVLAAAAALVAVPACRETASSPAGGGPSRADAAPPAGKAPLEPVEVHLPTKTFIGTPRNVPPGTRVKITKSPAPPRPPLLAPPGTTNVAAGKPVTSSDAEPTNGTLDLVTDRDKEAASHTYVELGPGLQYVQIDLQRPCRVHGILLWHEHEQPRVYHDVVIQLADDADLTSNVRTVYNSDHDNTAGLGVGSDWGYYETYQGLQVAVAGRTARYVRLYSNGNTNDDLNRYTEVEVYATDAK